MKSIGFFNNKGGVGKTTLICNLASSLAVNKKIKVLIIDADPQCNASAYLLPEEELEKILLDNKHNSLDSFYEPIRRGQGYPTQIPTIVRSERFKVDLIVGDPKLSIREDLLATDWASTRNGESRGFQTTYAIKELLSRLNNYDLVLVDMGPSLGALNRSVLLAVDYFLMPLSVDIFSLMAVGNIISSFDNWRQSLEDAIAKHQRDEGYNFKIANKDITWNLKFLGYVMQQYKAKTKGGIRQPVQAFERIIEKQKDEIANLCSAFNVNQSDVDLGVIPTLSSVVPLSQQAHAPVFSLGAQDGIVGSQYTRVSEAGEYFHSISEVLYARLFE
jgi:cellulose biosynthesis protein BcsQ